MQRSASWQQRQGKSKADRDREIVERLLVSFQSHLQSASQSVRKALHSVTYLMLFAVPERKPMVVASSMYKRALAHRHLIALIAALCGGAFGGAQDLWFWSGVPPREPLDILVWMSAGTIIGGFPGWSAGLLAMLLIEKWNLRLNRVIVPAIVSFLAACAVTLTVWLLVYFWLAPVFAGG